MIAHAGKDVEQGEHSSTSNGSEKLYNHFEVCLVVSDKTSNKSTSRPSLFWEYTQIKQEMSESWKRCYLLNIHL